MKIVLGSDFHLEHKGHSEIPGVPPCDLLVLAGDIHTGIDGLSFAESIAKGPTIYVPGNHEYYYYSKILLDEAFAKYEHEDVMILNPGVVEHEDFVIIGATLHSNLMLPGYPYYEPEKFGPAIGDFHVTGGWTPLFHIKRHLLELQFITQMLQKYRDRRCIVVTHFVPSMQAIAPFWKGNPLNPYFINDLDYLIDEYKPELWLFGHTHDKHDFIHSNGKTRMVCNPRGYPREKPRKFKWKELEL